MNFSFLKRPEAPAYSQVGRGASWTGRLAGSGMLIVLGEAAADLALGGEVVVGPAGRLTTAAGRCGALRVEGLASGAFRVDGPVAVAPGGRLSGSISARRFDAARAAHLDGRLDVAVTNPDTP